MARTRCRIGSIPAADGTGTSYEASDAVHNESLYSVVDVSNNTTTVYNGPAILVGAYVNTALSAHVLPIEDNTTTVCSLPASAAAGSVYSFPGIRFETSLIVNPNDAATGSVTIAYRPL